MNRSASWASDRGSTYTKFEYGSIGPPDALRLSVGVEGLVRDHGVEVGKAVLGLSIDVRIVLPPALKAEIPPRERLERVALGPRDPRRTGDRAQRIIPEVLLECLEYPRPVLHLLQRFVLESLLRATAS